jgi:hypothetical protein
MEQQECHPDVAKLWWKRYIQDVDFRLDQECEAYGAQYKLICQMVKDRNRQAKNLWAMADILAGPLYGNIVGRTEAMKRIKSYSH